MSGVRIPTSLLQVIGIRPTIIVGATLNNDVGAHVALSGGNLTYTSTAATTACSARSTTTRASSKVYFEATVVANGDCFIGFGNSSFVDTVAPGVPGYTSNSYGWRQNGETYYNGGATAIPSAGWTNGHVLAFAVDIAGQKAYFNDLSGTDGWNNGAGNPGAGTGGESFSSISGALNVIIADYNSTGEYTLNFGASAFTGSIPSGFVSWNSGS